MTEATVNRLLDDLKAVAADAEALLAATASDASERVREVRQRASASLKKARERVAGLEADLKDRAVETAREIDTYVHHKPWHAVAVAAGVGALIGLLLGRR
jgi:ElaB/YqjD/DUF883 family membrane-anchored ribosome-binding protein